MVHIGDPGLPDLPRRPVRSRPRVRVRDGATGHPSYRHAVPILGVPPGGYYAWRQRPLSARARADVIQGAQIQVIHGGSRGTYEVPRVHAELAAEGVHVGRKRGVSRRSHHRTTRRDPAAAPAPDLVSRDFAAVGPDRL